jgi:hypothetical protein
MLYQQIYILWYIHTDEPSFSEILGSYLTKDQAVKELLERANYREKNGQLTQYKEPTDEYPSFQALFDKVMHDMELEDVDIYRISEVIMD